MERCHRKLIASGDLVLVEQCSCGSVHVTIGAMTLRLASAAIPSLASTLGDAAIALVRPSALLAEEALS
jgi:hypothetical protein